MISLAEANHLEILLRPSEINLRALDALRGLLATYVLAGHARWLLWIGHADWVASPHPAWTKPIAYGSSALRYGHEAVMIFFVLSGFFIHLRAAQDLAQLGEIRFSTTTFLNRRLHRLLPPYIGALVLTVSIDLIGRSIWPKLYTATTGDALLDENFARKGFSLLSVLPALLMLPSSLGRDFGSNGPLWSLAYEVVYYTLYPVWLMLRRRGALLAYGSGVIISTIAGVLPQIQFISPVLNLYCVWLAGACLGEFLSAKSVPKSWSFGAACTFLLAFALLQFRPAMLLTALLYCIAGVAVVLIAARFPRSLAQTRLHASFEFLGIRSYTIYICHFPILTFLSAYCFQVFGARPISGWLAVGGGLIALSASVGLFELCERRFLHRDQKRTNRGLEAPVLVPS